MGIQYLKTPVIYKEICYSLAVLVMGSTMGRKANDRVQITLRVNPKTQIILKKMAFHLGFVRAGAGETGKLLDAIADMAEKFLPPT